MSLISIKSNQNLTIATVTKTIGFRTICFDQRPITSAEIDQGIGPGNRWNFEAKGHEIYCKGSNFVPPDVSWPRVTKERMEDLFESVIVSNMGWGICSSGWILSMADEMGIILWHDFKFSDASYPATSNLLTNVQAKAKYQVRYANSHPSAAVWSGGNEMELNIVDGAINIGIENPAMEHSEDLFNALLLAVFDKSRSLSFLPSNVTNGYLSFNY
ncbi:hypothetical protein BDZ45DRAFT_690716 [Acephala macrosclerotiorum]|nr:hypothetical protein BDZ45DRAFT_690716 [Acephala macrosclerotiorum]